VSSVRPWSSRFSVSREPRDIGHRGCQSGRVYACVGGFAQPSPDPRIGGLAIDLQSFGAELGFCRSDADSVTLRKRSD
jgi:hypothetical protein